MFQKDYSDLKDEHGTYTRLRKAKAIKRIDSQCATNHTKSLY